MTLYIVRHREVHDKYIEVVAEHQGQAVRKALKSLIAGGVGAKAGELEVVESLYGRGQQATAGGAASGQ